ncbi:MAG: APC family permease [Bacteroidetes bacterium]|nr:MAG: APC family permease [Bacteroidota bacterium]TAF92255.1 MAG: APC family permease [Bacteroidota bacterium]
MKQQQIGVFSLTMIVIGLVIGMGIFRTAATSAANAITPTVYFTSWLVGGFIAFCGALTYAEIGSRYPVTGGYYRVFAYAYHPSIAFGINCIILVSNAASLSGVALIGSGYLSKLFPSIIYTDLHKAFVSCTAIAMFYLLNLRGLQMSSTAQNILMLLKIGLIVFLISLLFGEYPTPPAAIVPTSVPTMDWITSLGASLIAVSFTYGGYQQTINFGKDIDNPSKNLPKGIFIGMAIVILLYLLVNVSYYSIVGFDAMKLEKEVAYAAFLKVIGSKGAIVFSFLLFVGVLSYVNALLLSNPRVMYAMANDGTLPKLFAQQNKQGALWGGLTLFTSLCFVILFFSQQFEQILSFTIFLDCFGMTASAAAIFKLRKQTKHLNGTGIYSMKFFPVFPVIFILAYVFVGASIAIKNPSTAVLGCVALAVFTALYFVIKKPATTVP